VKVLKEMEAESHITEVNKLQISNHKQITKYNAHLFAGLFGGNDQNSFCLEFQISSLEFV
jgi:hypothetical protein